MVQTVKNSLKRYFSVGSKSTFIVVLLIMILSMAIYNLRKSITVVIDGDERAILTYNGNLRSILEKNGIFVGPKDKIEPSMDSKVKDGDKVYIKKAVNVEVEVDGKELKIATSEEYIENMLELEGIVLSDYDKVQPLKTEKIKPDMKVMITRVESKLIKESKEIDFSTVVKKDDDLEKTVTKVEQEGEPGEREITTRVVYENGKEVTRQVVSDIVKKEPIQRVLVQGTLGVLNLSRGGGEKVLYKTSLRVKATAYTSFDPGVGTRTASGTTVKRNSNGYSTIAVDPRVIPLGTRVYVEGYGFAIAEDTGGAIKGNIIDVFLHSPEEARNWGVKYVNVYILK
jgi:uncharacterized protein YabE (DUF348 family)